MEKKDQKTIDLTKYSSDLMKLSFVALILIFWNVIFQNAYLQKRVSKIIPSTSQEHSINFSISDNTRCTDVADLWIRASQKEKSQECQKLLVAQKESLIRMGINQTEDCNLVEAKSINCESMGTTLGCDFKCKQTFSIIPTPTPTTKPIPTAYVILSPSSNWKTYTNSYYKFSLKYPSNYFVKSENQLLKISNSPDFEKIETAMIIDITIENRASNSLLNSLLEEGESDSVKILNERLDYENFKDKLNTPVLGAYMGDPPWGSYLIFIKHPNLQDQYLEISITTHQWEEPAYGGNYQDSNTARQILSTFKFLDENASSCKSNGGVWNEQYKECGGIKKEICEKIGGVFNACASPCRHDPSANLCIQVCEEVCSF